VVPVSSCVTHAYSLPLVSVKSLNPFENEISGPQCCDTKDALFPSSLSCVMADAVDVGPKDQVILVSFH